MPDRDDQSGLAAVRLAAAGNVLMRSLPLQAQGLAAELDQLTAPGVLYREHDGKLRCHACAHRCTLAEGARGVCGVRFNRHGQLRVPHGYVARRYVRAIETNTIFHVAPGTRALSFGMYGCDLRCPYCHNHRISQAPRDGSAAETPTPISAAALVAEARAAERSAVCAAYNEPLISAEWVREVFEAAKQHGLLTALISDGNATAETLRWLRPATDVLRIALKADSDARYRALGGRLQPVLDAIELGRMLGYWVEVVTLVVPSLTQDQKQIARIGAMLREIDPALPWHLNGFVPRYRLQSSPPASAVFMMVAAAAALLRGHALRLRR